MLLRDARTHAPLGIATARLAAALRDGDQSALPAYRDCYSTGSDKGRWEWVDGCDESLCATREDEIVMVEERR